MRKRFLIPLVLFSIVASATKYSHAQSVQPPVDSGLEIHLLIDCSKSVWCPSDPKELKRCLAEILEQISLNFRPIGVNGDCVAIYFFADSLQKVKPLDAVGQQNWKQEDIEKFLDSSLVRPETPRFKRLNSNFSNFRVALDGVYNDIRKTPSKCAGLEQTKILLIVSDGINDPRNQINCNRNDIDFEVAPLLELEDNEIANRLSEFRSFLKTEIFMIQLPSDRKTPELLSYAHVASWNSLLPDCRFAAIRLESIGQEVSDAFIKMRSVVFKDICIRKRFLEYDKRNWITGEFEFVTPQLLVDKLEIAIKLVAIYDKNKKNIPIDEDMLSGEQRKELLVLDRIYSPRPKEVSRSTSVKLSFKLPNIGLYQQNSMAILEFDITPKSINTVRGKEYLAFSFKENCEQIKRLTTNLDR